MTSLRDVLAVVDDLYDRGWAESWDAVGTVVGDPEAPVAKVLLAVDPVQAVVDEAVAWGADLLLTHHPLFLRGVTSVAATSPKGRVVHRLIENKIALHTCHTNADSPALGVSESMALALGLTEIRPLAQEAEPTDAWTVYVPQEAAAAVAEAMHDAGAGAIGNYDRAKFISSGTGSFRPLAGSEASVGSIGSVASVPEVRLELVAPSRLREQIRTAMRMAHPYEEVAHLVVRTESGIGSRGSGRIGKLPSPTTLGEFADHVVAGIADHHSAIRIAGSPDQLVSTVALCGGSGDFLLAAADAAGADVYVTSDLRHHPVSEHREQPGACAVIDVPHWAAEWTWLPVAAQALRERLGDTVDFEVSTIVTDPWTMVRTAR